MPEVLINGPDGKLEGKYYHSQIKNAPVALVLHPNPQHGGNMNNKVAYTLYKVFAKNGFSVLRFNFRGVGKSQGKFDDGVGELSDASSAMDWLQQYNQDALTYWISGFSFGAWLSMQLLMRRPEIERFVAVSPPANMYDFSFLSPCPRNGFIIQGDTDSIVDESSVTKLHNNLKNQKRVEVDYEIIKGADHFFRDKLEDLEEIIDDYVKQEMGAIFERGVIRPGRRRRQVNKKSLEEASANN
jgi:alpha/beta superfamily hydrolase